MNTETQDTIENEHLIITEPSNRSTCKYGSFGKSNATLAISNSLLSSMATLSQSRTSFINEAIRDKLKLLNITIDE